MTTKKHSKKPAAPSKPHGDTIDANELGELFEALRDFAERLDPEDGPSKRLFLLMLADRGDLLTGNAQPAGGAQ